MADESDPQRDAVHDAIQAFATPGRNAILTGWAVVAEWMDPEGDRWISQAHAATTSRWTANGMMHEALYGDWSSAVTDDE